MFIIYIPVYYQIGICLFIGSLFGIFFLVPKKAKTFCYIISIMLFIILFFLHYLYYAGSPFTRFLDMYINNETEHIVYESKQFGKSIPTYSIPLPPKTIFAYRYAYTDAAYITKTSVDDIIDFYSEIATSESIIVKDENDDKDDIKSITFDYYSDRIYIKIRRETWTRRRIFINVIERRIALVTDNSSAAIKNELFSYGGHAPPRAKRGEFGAS